MQSFRWLPTLVNTLTPPASPQQELTPFSLHSAVCLQVSACLWIEPFVQVLRRAETTSRLLRTPGLERPGLTRLKFQPTLSLIDVQ